MIANNSPLPPVSRHPEFIEGSVSIQTSDATTVLSIEQVRNFQSPFFDMFLEGHGLLEKTPVNDAAASKPAAIALQLPFDSKAFKRVVRCMRTQVYVPPPHAGPADLMLFNDCLSFMAPRPHTEAIAAAEQAKAAAIEAAKVIPKGFVRIEAGEFTMGSPAGEVGSDVDEASHAVLLPKAYFLQAHPVTQRQWLALMHNNPSCFNADGPDGEQAADRPVEMVSLYDAWAFCNALSRQENLPEYYNLTGFTGTPGQGDYRPLAAVINPPHDVAGQGYRLPSEAEWEKAARSGELGARYGELDAIAWYNGNSGGRTHPVGTNHANPAGLHDMLGNVCERLDDVYTPFFEDEVNPHEVTVDPRIPTTETTLPLVVRGGSWYREAHCARLAARECYRPHDRRNHLGFRLARFAPPKPLSFLTP